MINLLSNKIATYMWPKVISLHGYMANIQNRQKVFSFAIIFKIFEENKKMNVAMY
tara:strand:+ start:91 stop:255 length:165 start_codon:yes stop_codon:yes gene_type:complete